MGILVYTHMNIGDANCNTLHERTSNFKDPSKSGFDFTVIADNFPGADLGFFTNWMGAKLLHI